MALHHRIRRERARLGGGGLASLEEPFQGVLFKVDVETAFRLSDPFAKIEKLTRQVKQLLEALAEEKVRVMDLTNRNDELRTLNNRLHSEVNEVRASMAELKKAFEKNGETIARLADDLKEEREKRDQQFMQWTREKAARGDL